MSFLKSFVKGLWRSSELRQASEPVLLCETCLALDLPRHLFEPWALFDTWRSNDPSTNEKSTFEYGYWYDIQQRRPHCNLCDMVARNAWGTISGSDDDRRPEFELYGVRTGSRSARSSSASSRWHMQAVNQVLVKIRRHHALYPGLRLTPASNPPDTVMSYYESESLFNTTQRFSGRLIEQTTNVKLLQKWLCLCEQRHGVDCEEPRWLGPNEYAVKLRALDVYEMNLTDIPARSRYIALSYVWGNALNVDRSWQASKKSMHGLGVRGSLRKTKLPQTIVDAMRLVLDIGERYLWIDSLCIIQDDLDDKSFQIAQMDLIYARAVFTIVAGVGSDSEAGLPHLYQEIRTVSQDYAPISEDLSLMVTTSRGQYGSTENTKWPYRGWTYQELVLSRRAIIFLEDQIHWCCESDYWNEKVALEPSISNKKPCIAHDAYYLGFLQPNPRFSVSNLDLQIHGYNRDRDFTNESDIVAAFQGIINRIRYFSDVEFHWGLPRRNFAQSIMWKNGHDDSGIRNSPRECLVPKRPQNSTAYSVDIPSWSWMRWRGVGLDSPQFPWDERGKVKGSVFTSSQPIYNAVEWYSLSIDGKLGRLETNSDGRDYLIKSNLPAWAEPTPELRPSSIDADFRDSGKIVTWTSHARLRIRTLRVQTLIGPWPEYYKVISFEGDEIGYLDIVSVLEPKNPAGIDVWKLNESERKEEMDQYLDFVVLSQVNWMNEWGNFDSQKTEVMLNIMCIDIDKTDEKIASRTGLFRILESVWIKLERNWRRIVLK